MGVEFETDRINQMQRMAMMGSNNAPAGLTGWLIKKGYVNSEAAAQKVLVGIMILNIFITIFVIFKFIL